MCCNQAEPPCLCVTSVFRARLWPPTNTIAHSSFTQLYFLHILVEWLILLTISTQIVFVIVSMFIFIFLFDILQIQWAKNFTHLYLPHIAVDWLILSNTIAHISWTVLHKLHFLSIATDLLILLTTSSFLYLCLLYIWPPKPKIAPHKLYFPRSLLTLTPSLDHPIFIFNLSHLLLTILSLSLLYLIFSWPWPFHLNL